MKALITRGMTDNSMIVIPINEGLLYHIHSGMKALNELAEKLEVSAQLILPIAGLTDLKTYKLADRFASDLRNDNTTLPEDGIEYLLVVEDDDIIFTPQQKENKDWLVIEYPDQYHDNPTFDTYFENLKEVFTTNPNHQLLLEKDMFHIEVFHIALKSLISTAVDYPKFEDEIRNELNLEYKRLKTEKTLRLSKRR